eukprot:6180230-Pleurochrysis_carterae.AAC.1
MAPERHATRATLKSAAVRKNHHESQLVSARTGEHMPRSPCWTLCGSAKRDLKAHTTRRRLQCRRQSVAPAHAYRNVSNSGLHKGE